MIEVKEFSYHRNGVCGEGFYAVLFRHDPEENGVLEDFLAILFDGSGQCAVIGLDRIAEMGVKFANGNSWRGDRFESELREAIKTGTSSGSVRVGPFGLPTE